MYGVPTPTSIATFLPTLTLPIPVLPEIEAIAFDAPYVSDWDYAEEILEPRDSGFALRFRSAWYVRSRVSEQNDIILSANVRLTGGRFSIYTHVTDIAWYRFAVSVNGTVELYRSEQVVASTTIGAIPDTWFTLPTFPHLSTLRDAFLRFLGSTLFRFSWLPTYAPPFLLRHI
jgi:hypothetical protein